MPWTARFRCRISKNFQEDKTELEITIAGRRCLISSGNGEPLCKSSWIIFEFTDFKNESEAKIFGEQFLEAILISSALNNTGIDPGENTATSGFGDVVAAAVAKSGGVLRQNVHGLMFYESQGNDVFFEFSGSAIITQNTEKFISSINEYVGKAKNVGTLESLSLKLLALSGISSDPLSKAALAISAVEALSASPPWTVNQSRLIAKLKSEALAANDVPDDEKTEIANALDRLFRSSIRQSIKRKMASLGLSQDDWIEFDEVYNLRSRIFHGSASGRENYNDLASKSAKICTKIVLSATGI
ncbi:hypothetical protein ABLE93_21220 [Xanthobacter sp. KR7-65]|uniref:hypothetical protein n=1 Tax=Xanthobacter sp. KR7-65 TaxID=3156612 RepID=UPI0032B5DA54